MMNGYQWGGIRTEKGTKYNTETAETGGAGNIIKC